MFITRGNSKFVETQLLKFLFENWQNPLAIIALLITLVIYLVNYLNKKEKTARKTLSEVDFEHYENLKCIKYNEIITLLEQTIKLIEENNKFAKKNAEELKEIYQANTKQNEIMREKFSEHLIRQKMSTDLLLNIHKNHD